MNSRELLLSVLVGEKIRTCYVDDEMLTRCIAIEFESGRVALLKIDEFLDDASAFNIEMLENATQLKLKKRAQIASLESLNDSYEVRLMPVDVTTRDILQEDEFYSEIFYVSPEVLRGIAIGDIVEVEVMLFDLTRIVKVTRAEDEIANFI